MIIDESVMHSISFQRALTSIYIQNPCRVLPNALWKTLAVQDEFECKFHLFAGEIRQLDMRNDRCLHLYWNINDDPPTITEEEKENLERVLLHINYADVLDKTIYSTRKLFFRLIHYFDNHSEVRIAPNSIVSTVDVECECKEVANFIRKCYPGIRIHADTVRSWIQHPVFNPALWIWGVDNETGKKVALGIAEFDPNIREGSLEWIQVLPRFRGQGWGAKIVFALMNRLRAHANFVTVAGEIENPNQPIRLYRQCGFTGDDTWWYLKR
jgi:GNAT superfamily N-acetyltransferase